MNINLLERNFNPLLLEPCIYSPVNGIFYFIGCIISL